MTIKEELEGQSDFHVGKKRRTKRQDLINEDASRTSSPLSTRPRSPPLLSPSVLLQTERWGITLYQTAECTERLACVNTGTDPECTHCSFLLYRVHICFSNLFFGEQNLEYILRVFGILATPYRRFQTLEKGGGAGSWEVPSSRGWMMWSIDSQSHATFL